MNRNPKTSHLTQYKWVKGQSGNIAGRSKSAITVLKELGYTKPVICAMVAEICFMSMDEVRSMLLNDGKEPVIRVAIAEAFKKASYEGEYKYIADYMRLLIGNPSPVIPPNVEPPPNSNNNS